MEELRLPTPTPDLLSSEPPLNTPLSITSHEDLPLLSLISNNPSPTKHAKPLHAASYPLFAATTSNNHYQHITVPSAPSPSFPLRNQTLRPSPPPHTSTASTSDWTRLTFASDTTPSMPTRPTTANDIRIDTSASSRIFGPSNSSEASPLHTRRRSDLLSDNPLPSPGTPVRRREARRARRWTNLTWGGHYSQSPILPIWSTSWWPRLLQTGGTRQPAPDVVGSRGGGDGGDGGERGEGGRGEAISPPCSVHFEDEEETKPPPKDLLWLVLMIMLPFIFLLLGVGIGVGVYIWFTRLQNNEYISTFAWECVQRGGSIKAAFDDTAGFLQDVSSFMAVSPLVNSESIWAFADPAWSGPSKKSEFLDNFGYIQHVYNSDRAAWEAEYASITELVGGKLVPQPVKPDYYPVQYVFPPSLLSNASVGFDAASSPVRLAAMQRASATNQPSLSDLITLVYNISTENPAAGVGNGVNLFIPFYGQRTNATIIANEAANGYNNNSVGYPLQGFLAGAYDLNMLFSNELQNPADQEILFQAIDAKTNTTLFQHPADVTPGMFDPSFTTSYQFAMADRTWKILCTPPMANAPGLTIPVVLIIIIIVFFLLTSVLTRNFARQYLQARRRVYLQTARLGKTHNILQAIQQDSKAILQSIADPIVALDRFGYVVGANEHALRLTGYTGEELQVDDSRMHISQLLIPTSTQSTPSPSAPASRANSLASRKSQPPPHITVTMDITDALDPASSVPPTPGSEVPPAEPSFPLRSGMREMFARRKDGVTFEVQANFSEAALRNNHFTQVVSFRDVSLQRRAEREVLEAKMRAEEADRSKSEFLFFLCHEIRNPTHAITNLASMLHQKMAFDSDSAARYDLDCIITSANFMSALVSDILDLTRLTQADLAADLGLKCERFDVAEVLENVKRMVDGRRREETDDDNVSDDEGSNNNNSKTDEEEEQQEDDVSCWVDPVATASTAPPVFGDEYRLQQALFKMVDWVSETSTGAKREVRLGAKIIARHAIQGICVRFAVDDVLPGETAEGVLEEDEVVVDAEDIFRPYARANTSLGARFHASGFGMALARRIVEVMGGELRARTRRDGERQVSCGADFEVWLPTRESIDLRDGRAPITRRPGLKNAKSFREGTESRAKSEPAFGGEESEGDVFRRWSHGHGPHTLHPEGKKTASQALGTTKEEEGTVAQHTTRPDDGSSIAQRLGFGALTDEGGNSVELKDLSRTSVDSGTELPHPERTVSSASTAMSQISSSQRTPSPSVSLRRSVSPPTSRDRPVSSPPVSLSSPLARHSSVSQKGKNRALSSPSRLPGMLPSRVLVVEDNLICQRVTKKMLERNDFVVTVANNGQEAVDIVLAAMREPGPPPPTPAWEEEELSLQQEGAIEGKEMGPKEPFACVIMDIMTPLLTGYEATRLLREHGIKMPIIALTANSFTEDMKHAEEVGMDGFLTKPVTEKALVSAIRDEIVKSKNRNEE